MEKPLFKNELRQYKICITDFLVERILQRGLIGDRRFPVTEGTKNTNFNNRLNTTNPRYLIKQRGFR